MESNQPAHLAVSNYTGAGAVNPATLVEQFLLTLADRIGIIFNLQIQTKYPAVERAYRRAP